MAALFRRKKLELIVHQPHLERYRRLLDEHGVSGYTVLPTLGGKGTHGAWRPERLTDASDRVVLSAVLSEETAAALMEALDEVFAELPGVAFLSDVEVLRPDRF